MEVKNRYVTLQVENKTAVKWQIFEKAIKGEMIWYFQRVKEKRRSCGWLMKSLSSWKKEENIKTEIRKV